MTEQDRPVEKCHRCQLAVRTLTHRLCCPETRLWFDHVWPKASGLLFLKGRLHFCFSSGKRAPANAGAPSVLVAYGERDARVLASQPIEGRYVDLAGSVAA